MSEDVNQPPENDPSDAHEAGENESTQVLRSSGAQGGTQSPLLASLLKETLLHAEKEKESLDASLRETETQARRAEEEAAAVRRAEIQQKVEEEQQRRREMLNKRSGTPEPEAEPEGPKTGVQASSGMSVPVMGIIGCLVIGAFVLGYLYMETAKERDLANAAQAEVQKNLADLSLRVASALEGQKGDTVEAGNANALAVIQTLSDRFEVAVQEKEEAAARIQSLEKEKASLKTELDTQTKRGAELDQNLKTKTDELATLTAELEEVLSSKGRKRKKPPKKTSGGGKDKPPSEPEVKKTNDLFGSGRD